MCCEDKIKLYNGYEYSGNREFYHDGIENYYIVKRDLILKSE